MDQSQKAHLFQALHVGADALLLPNAWDAISARIMEEAGFPAIATASAAIALSHGVADGEQLSRQEMVEAVRRICGAVSVPVSADIESGYGRTSDEVAETVRSVISAGAVGINIEDSIEHMSLRSADDMKERITAARGAAESEGIELYINARIDACLLGMTGEAAFDETVSRAKAYLEAGASGIFVITRDTDLMTRIAHAVTAPLNVLAMDAEMPSVQELAALGVRRISTGPRLMQAMMGLLSAGLNQMRETGRFDLFQGAPSFDQLEVLFRADFTE